MAELIERREEVLEQIRETSEAIAWLRAELKVLKRPAPKPGFFASLRQVFA